MTHKFSRLIILSIAILSTILFFILNTDETIILPISSFLIIISLLVDFYLTRIKIKKGFFLLIGKKKHKMTNFYISIVLGICWIILGVLSPFSSLHWQGVDSRVFLGVLFITTGIFRQDNFSFLIKEKFIVFDEFIGQTEWRISKIEKVMLTDNSASFFKNERKKEYYINENEMPRLKSFLINKIDKGLII